MHLTDEMLYGNNARKASRQIIGKLFSFVEKCMHIVAAFVLLFLRKPLRLLLLPSFLVAL